MEKETVEITTIRAGLALLHSILTTDGSYTISCMTVWDNARNALNDTATTLAAKDAEIERLREALNSIEQWKLPATGDYYESGTEMSYEALYGSNGARDYIRAVARAALAAKGK